MKQYYFTVFTALYLLYCIFLSFYLHNQNHILYAQNKQKNENHNHTYGSLII